MANARLVSNLAGDECGRCAAIHRQLLNVTHLRMARPLGQPLVQDVGPCPVTTSDDFYSTVRKIDRVSFEL